MRFPSEAFELLRNHHYLSTFLPGKQHDFQHTGLAQQLHLLRQVGTADLSVARIFEGHLNALYLILQYASENQQQFWYAEAENGKIFGVWNTQAQNGITIQNSGQGQWMIEGSKTFCSGSDQIDYPLITGELAGKGWQMIVVPLKTSGLVPDKSFWDPFGMRASVSHRLDFSGLMVNERELLGQPGDYYRQPGFGGGAIRFSAVQVGGAQAIFDATVDYLRDLGRTGDHFQQQRISEMTILMHSGIQWIDHAGNCFTNWMKDQNKVMEMLTMANMMRAAVEEICTRMMQLSEKCVGARGLMRPGKLERIHRDLRYYLRQPAPDATFIAIGDYILNSNKRSDDLWR